MDFDFARMLRVYCRQIEKVRLLASGDMWSDAARNNVPSVREPRECNFSEAIAHILSLAKEILCYYILDIYVRNNWTQFLLFIVGLIEAILAIDRERVSV